MADSLVAQPVYALAMLLLKQLMVGPIAFVKNGDRVRIDTKNRTLDLLVDEKEMAERKKNFKPIPHKYRRGVLAKYSKLVGSSSKGCGLRLIAVLL